MSEATIDGFTRDLLLAVIPAVVVGVVTAILSVKLALRRFRQERWWERKSQAYTDLFAALFHVQRYNRVLLSRIEEGTQVSSDYLDRVAELATEGYSEIRKSVALGTFVFSAETAGRLEALQIELDDPRYDEDAYEETTALLSAVTSAIADLKPLAKRDLALKK